MRYKCLYIVLLSILLVSCGKDNAPPAPLVVVEKAIIENMVEVTTYPATIQAISTVDVKARIEGFLETIEFTEGQMVEPGEFLYQIEPYQYEAEVAKNRAELAKSKAVLTENTLNVERYRTLYNEKVVSASIKDQAESNYYQAVANVEAADAALKTAELNLSYTKIISPIEGRIGATSMYPGDYLSPTSGILASIVQLDPIRAVFSLTEEEWLELSTTYDNLYIALTPTLHLANKQEYPQKGEIDFIDNHINTNTGTIAVYAKFANPDDILLPGQFISLTLQEGEQHEAITLSSAAVLFDKKGHYVLALDKENKVEQRPVTLGITRNDRVEIATGIKAGESVIIEGVQKVMPGMTVTPQIAQKEGA